MTVLIGNGCGFWGDQIGAPLRLVQQVPELDYLTLEYLSEVSLSILAIQREKDPSMGYAQDFIEVIDSLIPEWNKGKGFKVITNAGGINPLACGTAIQVLLKEKGERSFKIAVVYGDDVLGTINQDKKNLLYAHLETGVILDERELMTANAYLGAEAIVQPLINGADIVITGRVADPSLTLAPAMFHHGWDGENYDLLAQGTLAGHLIECGTQVTGGLSHRWLELDDVAGMGFPLVEIAADGSFVVTKPENTGGEVTLRSVREQLVYEVADPGNYLSPDVRANFLEIALDEVGKNRIKISGAKGLAPSPTYKVSGTYHMGYRAESYLALYGENLKEKGEKIAEVIFERVKRAGYHLEETDVSIVGYDAVTPLEPVELPLKETLVRIVVRSQDREAVERFTKEIAPLVTSGPAGVTGYTTGRSPVRPQFGYWPCLIGKREIKREVSYFEVE